jgi:hypothetical protein
VALSCHAVAFCMQTPCGGIFLCCPAHLTNAGAGCVRKVVGRKLKPQRPRRYTKETLYRNAFVIPRAVRGSGFFFVPPCNRSTTSSEDRLTWLSGRCLSSCLFSASS